MTLATPEAAAPAAAPAASLTPELPAGFRLVPALIGRSDNPQHAWVPCPEWCTIDHSTSREVAIEDISHYGDFIDFELPHRDGTELLAYFRPGVDLYSSDPANRRMHIFAEDGTTANGYHMDPEHIEAMCDKAEKAIAQLRAMARAVAA